MKNALERPSYEEKTLNSPDQVADFIDQIKDHLAKDAKHEVNNEEVLLVLSSLQFRNPNAKRDELHGMLIKEMGERIQNRSVDSLAVNEERMVRSRVISSLKSFKERINASLSKKNFIRRSMDMMRHPIESLFGNRTEKRLKKMRDLMKKFALFADNVRDDYIKLRQKQVNVETLGPKVRSQAQDHEEILNSLLDSSHNTARNLEDLQKEVTILIDALDDGSSLPTPTAEELQEAFDASPDEAPVPSAEELQAAYDASPDVTVSSSEEATVIIEKDEPADTVIYEKQEVTHVSTPEADTVITEEVAATVKIDRNEQPVDKTITDETWAAEAQPQSVLDTIQRKFGDNFDIQEELGAGGLGVVYKIEKKEQGKELDLLSVTEKNADGRAKLDKIPDGPLVLKWFKVPASKDANKMMLQEGQVAQMLSEHENIGKIHHVAWDYTKVGEHIDLTGKKEEDWEFSFGIMGEYIEGDSLENKSQKGEIELTQLIKNMAEVSDALDYAHSQNVIHYDMKPDNIMITKAGVAQVIDFGLARGKGVKKGVEQILGKAKDGTKKTFKETFDYLEKQSGTLFYMSPEQAQNCIDGVTPITAKSDIYSLGATLHNLITGRMLFEAQQGEPIIDILDRVRNGAIDEPKDLVPHIPETLNALVMKMLAKNPDNRPDASYVKTTLEAIIEAHPDLDQIARAVETADTRKMSPSELPSDADTLITDSHEKETVIT